MNRTHLRHLALLLLLAGIARAQTPPQTNPLVGTLDDTPATAYYFNNSLITDYAARSGTWAYRDTIFSNIATSNATLAIYGYSASGSTAAGGYQDAASHPALVTGTNLTIIANGTTSNGRSAIGLREGGRITLYSSTIAQTAINTATGYVEAIYITDGSNQGGSHFRGENVTLTIAATPSTTGIRGVAIGAGANSATFVDSTIFTESAAAALAWNGNGDNIESTITLKNTNVTTTAAYAPAIQYVGDIARLHITGGTIATTGANSPVLRLGAGNLNDGRSKLQATITGATLTAASSYALDLNYDPTNTTNYWTAASPGNNTGHQGIYEIALYHTTLAGAAGSLRLATTGRDNSPTLTEFHLHLDQSTLGGDILMHPGDASTYTTGVKLYLTATDSTINGGLHIAGVTAALHAHQAVLELKNTPINGSITTDNRAALHLRPTNSPIAGTIALTGSTTAYLNHIDSPIATTATAGAGIALADTARLEATLTRSTIGLGLAAIGTRLPDTTLLAPTATLTLHDSNIDGPLVARTGARLAIALNGSSSITGPVTLDDHATLTLALARGARLHDTITINNRSSLAIIPADNQTLALTSPITINSGTWIVAAKTNLSATLVAAGLDATIAIPVADTDILTLTAGISGTARLLVEKIAGSPLGSPEIRIIHDTTGRFLEGTEAGPLRLAAPVDLGLASYQLIQRPDGAYLSGGIDTRGAAIANTTALAPQDLLDALAPIDDHLTTLRNTPASDGSGKPARLDKGALWLAARASDAIIAPPGDILDYQQHTLGITAGIDLRHDHPNSASTTLGAYADTSRITRDFHASADGTTTTVGAGLYAQYRHPNGPFATAIARYDTHKNTLDTHEALSADYNTQSAALALALGWRLEKLLPAGLWLEPSAGVALASIKGATYTTNSQTTENNFPVAIGSTRVTRLHAALAAGIPVNNTVHLRARAAYATHDFSGGAITVNKIPGATFTYDEPEIQLSLAADIRLTKTASFTVSAGHTVADQYTRPWRLALAYTRAW